MAHRFFDHTGDIAVHLEGETLDELFGSAAHAFAEAVLDAPDMLAAKTQHTIVLEATDLEALLVDFLSELLYLFDAEAWVARNAEIRVAHMPHGWSLSGALRGEALDPARHTVRILLKAVTYHGLHVQQHKGRWDARVVFDI